MCRLCLSEGRTGLGFTVGEGVNPEILPYTPSLFKSWPKLTTHIYIENVLNRAAKSTRKWGQKKFVFISVETETFSVTPEQGQTTKQALT